MIHIGVVKEIQNELVLVTFEDLDTEVLCNAVQVANNPSSFIFGFPSVGDQVACLLQGGRNLLLGSIYSNKDTLPADKGDIMIKSNSAIIRLEKETGKIDLRNSAMSFKQLLNDIVEVIKTLKVITPAGNSTNLTPDSILKIQLLENNIKQLLK